MSAPNLSGSREPQSGDPASSDADSLVKLVNQLSDPARATAAMTDLWVRVEGYLKWRVASLIAERHAALVGPESVANEAYHCFLKLNSSGNVHIADRGGLLALLSKIAIRKLIDRVRRLEAKKRRPHSSSSTLMEDSASGIPSDADMAALKHHGA